MNGGNGSLNAKLPVFDENNWNRWMIHMRVLFGAQDVLDLVNDGYITIVAIATKAQRNAYRNKEEETNGFVIYPSVYGYECV